MANASTADGKYIFNFKRVKATQEEKIKWLNELNSMLEKPEYFTFFYGLDKKLDLNNEITLNFSGNGCWTYEENIRWFQQDKELIDHMKKMPNLKIKISYKEYEEGEGFISRAKLKLNVTKEKITIKKTFEKTQDFSQELFVRWGFGTKGNFMKNKITKIFEKLQRDATKFNYEIELDPSGFINIPSTMGDNIEIDSEKNYFIISSQNSYFKIMADDIKIIKNENHKQAIDIIGYDTLGKITGITTAINF